MRARLVPILDRPATLTAQQRMCYLAEEWPLLLSLDGAPHLCHRSRCSDEGVAAAQRIDRVAGSSRSFAVAGSVSVPRCPDLAPVPPAQRWGTGGRGLHWWDESRVEAARLRGQTGEQQQQQQFKAPCLITQQKPNPAYPATFSTPSSTLPPFPSREQLAGRGPLGRHPLSTCPPSPGHAMGHGTVWQTPLGSPSLHNGLRSPLPSPLSSP